MTSWQMLLQGVKELNEIVKMILSALIGGSGLCGIAFLFIRHYIEKRLAGREEQEKKDQEIRQRRRIVNDKIQHANGRLLFWVVKVIETGEHNDDLRNAFEELEKAEEEAKMLDREILALHEEP